MIEDKIAVFNCLSIMHQQCHEKKTRYLVSNLGTISKTRARTENLEFCSNMEDFWSKCDEKFKGHEKNERYIILSKHNEVTEYVTNITHSAGRKIAYFTRFNLLNIVSDWGEGMIWKKLSRVGQERLGPSHFFIPLVLGPLNSLVWYVPSLRYTRSLGWRMHCDAEVTESSTNKQHHLSQR